MWGARGNLELAMMMTILGRPSTGKERRAKRENLLLLGYAITAHPLASIVEFVQDILRDDVAGANNTHAHGDGRPVAAEPSPRCSEHDEWYEAATTQQEWYPKREEKQRRKVQKRDGRWGNKKVVCRVVGSQDAVSQAKKGTRAPKGAPDVRCVLDVMGPVTDCSWARSAQAIV